MTDPSVQLIKFSHLVALEQNKSLAETYLIVFMFLLTTLMCFAKQTPDFVPFSNVLLYAYFALLQIYSLCVQGIHRWQLDKIFDFVTQKSGGPNELTCTQCVNPGNCKFSSGSPDENPRHSLRECCKCRDAALLNRREQEIDLFSSLI